MESSKRESCLSIINGNLYLISDFETQTSPDGMEELTILCAHPVKLCAKYNKNSKVSTDDWFHVSRDTVKIRDCDFKKFPLIKNLSFLLSVGFDTKKLANLMVFFRKENTYCFITNLDQEKKTASLFKYQGKEATVYKDVDFSDIYPILPGTVLFTGRNAGTERATHATHRDIVLALAMNTSICDTQMYFCNSNVDYKKLNNSASYGTIGPDLCTSKVTIPKFMLSKKNEYDITPIATFKSESCTQNIYDYAFAKKEGMVFVFPHEGDRVVVKFNDELKLATVVESPSTSNFHHLGVKFLDLKDKDHVNLASGKLGLYVNPTSVFCISESLNLSRNEMVKVVDYTTKDMYIESEDAKVLNDSVNSKFVMCEFKKDVKGSSADGTGSPGRCLMVPIGNIRLSKKSNHSFLESSLIAILDEDVEESFEKIIKTEKEKLKTMKVLPIKDIIGKPIYVTKSNAQILNIDSDCLWTSNYLLPLNKTRFYYLFNSYTVVIPKAGKENRLNEVYSLAERCRFTQSMQTYDELVNLLEDITFHRDEPYTDIVVPIIISKLLEKNTESSTSEERPKTDFQKALRDVLNKTNPYSTKYATSKEKKKKKTNTVVGTAASLPGTSGFVANKILTIDNNPYDAEIDYEYKTLVGFGSGTLKSYYGGFDSTTNTVVESSHAPSTIPTEPQDNTVPVVTPPAPPTNPEPTWNWDIEEEDEDL